MEQIVGTGSTLGTHRVYEPTGPHGTGVSWPAILGGAFAMAATALVLLSLGAGLGLASVSPWSGAGASANALGAGAIVWLIIAELLSAALGGYITGRLRTRWSTVHTDEVYFRDTANGFLAWSVALVVTAAFLTSAATVMVGSAPDPAGAAQENHSTYFVDTLFRTPEGKVDEASAPARGDAAVIFEHALATKVLTVADRSYIDQLITTNAGVSIAEANRRTLQAFDDARMAADTARKATAHALLWFFIALLIGAFSASFAATIGGAQRDHVVVL